MSAFKAVLFDIGGVLVELDGMPSLAVYMGAEFEAATVHKKWMNSEWVIKHETGQVSATEFANGVVEELGLLVSANSFLERFCRWPTMLLPDCNQIIREVAARARVAALSNLSEVHWKAICDLGLDESQFEQTFVSYKTGTLKPSLDAYYLAADGLDLNPCEIVFVDDSQRNVEAANESGMKGIFVQSPSDVRRTLTEVGVLP